jgi:hypothetical protein
MNTNARLLLYVAIAAFTVLLSDLGKLDPEVAKEMYWTEWFVLIGSPIVAGLVAWRAFLDQSISIKAAAVAAKPKPPQ